MTITTKTRITNAVKHWDTLTLHNAIEDYKERIADHNRDGDDASYWTSRIVILMDEYARR